jgi:hypothetical protein
MPMKSFFTFRLADRVRNDSTSANNSLPDWNIEMVAKGVDFYLYSDSDSIRTEVTAPAFKQVFDRAANFKYNNLQISSANIPGLGSYTGTLQWITRNGAAEVTRQFQDINSYDAKLGRGTMSNMFKTPPLIGDTTVCWGFYDAGPGKAAGSKLTNQNQLYVYATRDQRAWMSELARRNSDVASGPFARFALPGAHDAGMFDMRAVMRMLNSPELYLILVASLALIPFVGKFIGAAVATAGGLARAFAPRAISNLSMTQKDDVRTMLDIGTRYFDFRPGTMHPSLKSFSPGVRYHQHGVVPGYPYIAFLEDVLRWLGENPGEIVVISANVEGFASEEMKPTAQEVANDLNTAIANVGASEKIEIGGLEHISLSYNELIQANRRLIFLNQIEEETSKFDSWSGAYGTLTPGPIIAAFERMTFGPPPRARPDYMVMQMQATPANVGAGVIAHSMFSLSDASSPMLATKPIMDAATNPWLRANAMRLPENYLMVLLNDFVDNCMVETAISITEQRAGEATRAAAAPFPTRRIPPRRPIPIR